MSNYPIFIDNVAFAKKNERLKGDLTLADCDRLDELLLQLAKNSQSTNSPTGKISYDLQGKTDAVGQQFLSLLINAEFTTICQRCLSDMSVDFALNFNYLISKTGDVDISEDDIDVSDDYDLQEPSQTMDVIALVEDELIMAMPIAPTHETNCKAANMQSGEKTNPFAALKGLIKS